MITKYNYNVITITFAGTEVDSELRYKGELLYYHTGTITLNVKLNSQSEDAIPLSVKEQITAPFERLFFTPSGAGAVTIYLSNPKDIKIESRQVQVDIVSQLVRDDSFRYYADQQKEFMGSHLWTPAASNYGMFELFNPSGSGKTAYVLAVEIFSQYTTNLVYLNRVSAQLASPTAIAKTNKNFRGSPAASVMNLQKKDDTTLPTISDYIDAKYWYAAGTSFALPLAHPNSIIGGPLVLAEGYGVRISSQVTAQPVGGKFVWVEI